MNVNPSTCESVENVKLAPSGRSTSLASIVPLTVASSSTEAVCATATGPSFTEVISISKVEVDPVFVSYVIVGTSPS